MAAASRIHVIGGPGSFVLDTEEDVLEVGDGIPFPTGTPNIGIPGSRVTRMIDPNTRQRALFFEIQYPHLDQDVVLPSVRIIPSIIQEVEPYNSNTQYLLFSALPYETLAFRVSNIEIVNRWGIFYWETMTYKYQVYFRGPTADAEFGPEWGVPKGPTPCHVRGHMLAPP